MALTKEENDLLCLVENGAPMGEMIRQHYWLPAVPSVKLEADGAPIRIRLLGTNLIAFRATDGSVGVLDEKCPHRKASLALARNEDNGLRCIYHGWKFNVKGEVIEAPNHTGNQEQFCKHVRTNRYTAVDRGGIVWVWLGKGRHHSPICRSWIYPPIRDRSPASRCPQTGCKVLRRQWTLHM